VVQVHPDPPSFINIIMIRTFLFILLFFIASCSGKKYVDIKSPCVSAKDGPCGPKIPVNDWWLKDYHIES
jgi:hypothetical protein